MLLLWGSNQVKLWKHFKISEAEYLQSKILRIEDPVLFPNSFFPNFPNFLGLQFSYSEMKGFLKFLRSLSFNSYMYSSLSDHLKSLDSVVVNALSKSGK